VWLCARARLCAYMQLSRWRLRVCMCVCVWGGGRLYNPFLALVSVPVFLFAFVIVQIVVVRAHAVASGVNEMQLKCMKFRIASLLILGCLYC